MFTEKSLEAGRTLNVTILATMGWIVWMLGWLAFAWSGHSFLQNLASLGISTLLFSAIVAVLWLGNPRWAPLATILMTLGWFGFMLYWMAFVWGRCTLLLNIAALIASFLGYVGLVVIAWLLAPSTEYS
jgi:hypothetical protein